jgi:hypothetical protein
VERRRLGEEEEEKREEESKTFKRNVSVGTGEGVSTHGPRTSPFFVSMHIPHTVGSPDPRCRNQAWPCVHACRRVAALASAAMAPSIHPLLQKQGVTAYSPPCPTTDIPMVASADFVIGLSSTVSHPALIRPAFCIYMDPWMSSGVQSNGIAPHITVRHSQLLGSVGSILQVAGCSA